MFLGAVCMSPASPLVPEKPLENRLLAGCHASCDYELCRDSDGFYIYCDISCKVRVGLSNRMNFRENSKRSLVPPLIFGKFY